MDQVVTQEHPIPDEAYRHPGKWVAIHDREVVAVAGTLEELRRNPRVRRRDAVFKVPPPGPRFY